MALEPRRSGEDSLNFLSASLPAHYEIQLGNLVDSVGIRASKVPAILSSKRTRLDSTEATDRVVRYGRRYAKAVAAGESLPMTSRENVETRPTMMNATTEM